MYEVTSKPLVKRIRHTLRNAEFGFLGVVVYTRVHTPRFCGQASNAGTLLYNLFTRGLRTSWLIVAIKKLQFNKNSLKNVFYKICPYKNRPQILISKPLSVNLFYSCNLADADNKKKKKHDENRPHF